MSPHQLELLTEYIYSHPDSAARTLEQQSAADAAGLLQHLPAPTAEKIFQTLMQGYAARVCLALPIDAAAGMLRVMDATEIAGILRYLPVDQRAPFVKTLNERQAALVKLLLSYSEETVGALMSVDFVALPTGIAVAEAIERVREHDSDTELESFPVIDNSRKFMGEIRLPRLLRAKPTVPIIQLLTVPETAPLIPSRMRNEACAELTFWRERDTGFVQNRKQEIIGVLKHHHLRAVLTQPDTEINRSGSGGALAMVGEAYGGVFSAVVSLAANKKAL